MNRQARNSTASWRRVACASIGLVLSAGADFAEARRFDMKSESFATYFGASAGASALSDSAFGLAAGSGVTTDQVVPYNLSGEVGVIFGGENMMLRLGAEYVIGKTLTGVKGMSAAGTEYFSVDSKVGAVVPMVGFERAFKKWTDSRISFGAGAGWAAVSLDQEYRMTASGSAALGVSDYSEKASGGCIAWRAYLSGETHLVDTTTALFELGYRSIRVNSLQSTKDTTAISGTQVQGGDVVNSDGSARSLDLGGGYLSVQLRFYL